MKEQFEKFQDRGWVHFAHDAQVAEWAADALQHGIRALDDPACAEWFQCERTWFIGVDALPNDATGRLPDGPPLAGAPVEFINQNIGPIPELHRAQVSSVFPAIRVRARVRARRPSATASSAMRRMWTGSRCTASTAAARWRSPMPGCWASAE